MSASPHLAAMSLGVSAIERRGGFEDEVRSLRRAREEAERESDRAAIQRIAAARERARSE
ncbi:MAG: hypothetical protein ACK5MQ_08220 [Pikeienuella sp.]